jgi:hypothetical protein
VPEFPCLKITPTLTFQTQLLLKNRLQSRNIVSQRLISLFIYSLSKLAFTQTQDLQAVMSVIDKLKRKINK